MSKEKEKRVGFVYLLHFDSAISGHAQHYVGCTTNLRQRLVTHARGNGSRLSRAAAEQGVGFVCGAVGSCNLVTLKRVERQVKGWKNSTQFCTVCGEGKQMPGTQAIPVESIAWPTDSRSLAEMSPRPGEPVYDFTSADLTLNDVEQVRVLMKTEKDKIGFIPAGDVDGVGAGMRNGRMVRCRIDGALVGYCLFTENDQAVTIAQCVVDDRVRGCGVGRRMVEMIRRSRPLKLTKCRVREDLPANEFWVAIGFKLMDRVTHETSGSCLNEYRIESWAPVFAAETSS